MEDIGLSDVSKASRVSAHTQNYIRNVQRQLSACSAALRMTPREPQVDTYLSMTDGEVRPSKSQGGDLRGPWPRRADEEAVETRRIERRTPQLLDFGEESSKTSIKPPLQGSATGM